jgi:hypothetical protein
MGFHFKNRLNSPQKQVIWVKIGQKIIFLVESSKTKVLFEHRELNKDHVSQTQEKSTVKRR